MVKKKYVKRYKKKRYRFATIQYRKSKLKRYLFSRKKRLESGIYTLLLSGDKNPTGTESNTTNCPRYTFSTDIPDHYNETYICALPKNPEWMFVYWELGPEYQGSIAEQEKCGSKYVLRTEEFGVKVLNEIFSDAEKPLIVDTEIDARSNECYVRIPYSGKEYTITMG